MDPQDLRLALAAIAGAAAGAGATYFARTLADWWHSRKMRRSFIAYVEPALRNPAKRKSRNADYTNVGRSILEVLRDQENECERLSIIQIPKLGTKTPQTFEHLGRCLALLDAFSSCAWGCLKGDHVLERIVARAVNCARAALRLIQMGFYDEALALIRTIGEIANLLSLFSAKPGTFEDWKSLSDDERWRSYRPIKIRGELEKLATPIRVETPRYRELSSRAVHVGPQILPQMFDPLGRPRGGGYYQDMGMMLGLNELALALTYVMYGAAQLSQLESSIKQRILSAGADLIENTGGIAIDELDEMWKHLRDGSRTTDDD